MECSGVYAAASYAVRHFDKLKVELEDGQTRQDVADDFQRLSNILKYFATNSGHEEELRPLTKKVIEETITITKMTEDFDTVADDLERCDAYVDQLHEIYNE